MMQVLPVVALYGVLSWRRTYYPDNSYGHSLDPAADVDQHRNKLYPHLL